MSASFFCLSLQKIITMKKLIILALSLICLQIAMAQGWNAQLVSSSNNEIIVELNVDGFVKNNVTTPNGDAVIITNDKMMLMAQTGEPNVPSAVIPTIVGDDALMTVEVIDAQYVDYENMVVAPSKGDFPRSINPDDVPYTYGAMYQQDMFYPAQIARLDEPYIHRDVRGQNIIVTPYLCNPVSKTLRVYTHFTLRMVNVGVDSRNVIANRAKSEVTAGDRCDVCAGIAHERDGHISFGQSVSFKTANALGSRRDAGAKCVPLVPVAPSLTPDARIGGDSAR